ncbi:MAG: hypothetical protein GTO63_30830, partial [Anaerolineae bacterium]|nr:hypothetical protein [Anaerolineae bacterium]NIN99090.1 hypothetical protein [Anaerolineae bacterium]NIQ81934.1 hypothetical protein [Anaerolineae bacterium]
MPLAAGRPYGPGDRVRFGHRPSPGRGGTDRSHQRRPDLQWCTGPRSRRCFERSGQVQKRGYGHTGLFLPHHSSGGAPGLRHSGRKRHSLLESENLGRNNSADYITVQTVEQAFLNSPRHRAILLWPGYTNLGTGVAESGEGMKVYTVLFTQAPPGVAASQATATPAQSPSAEPTGTPVPSA